MGSPVVAPGVMPNGKVMARNPRKHHFAASPILIVRVISNSLVLWPQIAVLVVASVSEEARLLHFAS